MSETGTLVIQAYTARLSIPIAGVDITVFTEEGGKKQLLAYRTTDRDGKSDPVIIQTPDLALSQYPSSEEAFFSCDVQLDHPQYYSVLVEHVQVFAGIESLQRMEMIPLTAYDTLPLTGRDYEITPQNL